MGLFAELKNEYNIPAGLNLDRKIELVIFWATKWAFPSHLLVIQKYKQDPLYLWVKH